MSERPRFDAVDVARGVALVAMAALSFHLGSLLFRRHRALDAVHAADACGLASDRLGFPRPRGPVAGARARARVPAAQLRPAPAAHRRGGGPGQRRQLCDGAADADLLRHPALPVRGEPARRAAGGAALGRAGARRGDGRRAVRLRLARLRSALAGLAGPGNAGPLDARLAPAAALGRRAAARSRARAARPAAAGLEGAAGAAARPRLRWPPQPRDLSDPPADPDRRALCGAAGQRLFGADLGRNPTQKACRPACVEAGGEIETCERACACVVRDAKTAGLADRLGAHSLSPDARGRIGAIVETCGSQAR